jgi:hypothetical protein
MFGRKTHLKSGLMPMMIGDLLSLFLSSEKMVNFGLLGGLNMKPTFGVVIITLLTSLLLTDGEIARL